MRAAEAKPTIPSPAPHLDVLVLDVDDVVRRREVEGEGAVLSLQQRGQSPVRGGGRGRVHVVILATMASPPLASLLSPEG